MSALTSPLWDDTHGPVDPGGYVSLAPDGAVCIFCGKTLAGRSYVRTIAVDGKRFYVCEQAADHGTWACFRSPMTGEQAAVALADLVRQALAPYRLPREVRS